MQAEMIQANSKQKLRGIKKVHRTKGVRDRQFTKLRFEEFEENKQSQKRRHYL